MNTIVINKDSRYKPATEPVQDDGWMTPDGVFYPCGFWQHSACAMNLTGMYVTDLEKSGWAHISSNFIANDDLTLTQPQIDALFDMMMLDPNSELGRHIAGWLNDDDSNSDEEEW